LALTVAVLILATLVGGAVPEAAAVPPDSTLLLNMSGSDVDFVDPARAYYSVYGDTTVEPDETVLMRLSAPTAGALTRSLAVGTIVNDDVAPPPPSPPPAPVSPPPPPPPPPAAVCTVPNVRGQTVATARAALGSANCSTGRTTTRFSSVVRKGRVISQSARPGTQLDYGAPVDLVISKGRKPPLRVTLCHRGHTIKVLKSQVKKHLKHGDRRGACRKTKKRR
jgi:PASTA domain